MAELGHVGVVEAVHQRELVLHGLHPWAANTFGHAQPLRGSPRRLVRQSDVTDAARLDLGLQLAQYVLHVCDCAGLILMRRVVGPVLAEHVAAAVRPVQLIEVDVVGLEPPQRVLHSLAYPLGRDRCAVAHGSARPGDLGREHDVVAPTGFRDPVADDGLGASGRLGDHRVDRVRLGGVEEVDASVETCVDLRMADLFGRLRSKGHRSQAQLRDFEVGRSKRDVAHPVMLGHPTRLNYQARTGGTANERPTPLGRSA